jgi:flavin-dependent dehydrogenase
MNINRYVVIVVGGGLAGSRLAGSLARQDIRVAVLANP